MQGLDPPPNRPQARGGWLLAPFVWLAAVLRALLRLALALLGVLMLLGALVLGLVFALVLVVWALLRGKRPARGVFQASFHRARRRSPPPPSGPVIDIEAREVPDAEAPRPPTAGG